jgi:hypothetical protein
MGTEDAPGAVSELLDRKRGSAAQRGPPCRSTDPFPYPLRWRNPLKILKNLAVATIAAASLAACAGDGGTGYTGLSRGRFQGDVSGVLDIAVSGEAESGYQSSAAYHDKIVLTDYVRNVRVHLYESESEFTEGRWRIEDEANVSSRIVAWVEDLETGEAFGSVNGTLDLDDVRGGGIEGSAVFTAESYEYPGDYIEVDVLFNADFAGFVGYNRAAPNTAPAAAKSPR